jgi:hypothetical protein
MLVSKVAKFNILNVGLPTSERHTEGRAWTS